MAKENTFLNIFYVFLGISSATVLPVQFVLTDKLHVQPSEFDVIFKIAASLWMVKVLVGFVCNKFVNQVLWYKRLVTLMLLINSLCWFFLSSWSPVNINKTEIIALLWIVFSTLCVCDVATDGRMVKYVQLENGDQIGKTQTYSWAFRSFGRLLGGIAVTLLIERDTSLKGKVSPQQFLDGFVIIPILFIMIMWGGIEPSRRTFLVDSDEHTTCKQTLLSCWNLAKCNKKILAFMAILFLMPSSGSNIWLYLSESIEHHGLGFGTELLGIIGIVHSVSCIVGALLYRYCFRRTSVKKLFVVSILFGATMSALQLILLTGIYKDIGLSPKIFVLSDDVVSSILDEFLMLPLMIIMASTIDNGFETVGYALFTSLENIMSSLSSLLSAGMTEALGIQRDRDTNAIEFGNLWIMVIICAVLSLVPLLFICWVPQNIQSYQSVDCEEEDDENHIELQNNSLHHIGDPEQSDEDEEQDHV